MWNASTCLGVADSADSEEDVVGAGSAPLLLLLLLSLLLLLDTVARICFRLISRTAS
jgi:hypothetical protein